MKVSREKIFRDLWLWSFTDWAFCDTVLGKEFRAPSCLQSQLSWLSFRFLAQDETVESVVAWAALKHNMPFWSVRKEWINKNFIVAVSARSRIPPGGVPSVSAYVIQFWRSYRIL